MPRTPAEWQEAVDASAAYRLIADCELYGLIEGGGEINVDRCDYILQAGKARGVLPSRPIVELAVEMIRSINAAALLGGG